MAASSFIQFLAAIFLLQVVDALRGAHPSNSTSLASGLVCVPRDAPGEAPISISPAKINDDYCDCDDGSDEPGTAACPGAVFWCRNDGFRPVQLPSSWVDDGSCDCCDGSDEPAHACKDTCGEEKKRLLAVARKQADAIIAGVSKRQQYAKEAASNVEKDQAQIVKLEQQLKALNIDLKKSERRTDALRKRRDYEDDIRRAAEKHTPSPPKEQTTNTPDPSETESEKHDGTSDDDHTDYDSEDDDHHGTEIDNETDGDANDAKSDVEGGSDASSDDDRDDKDSKDTENRVDGYDVADEEEEDDDDLYRDDEEFAEDGDDDEGDDDDDSSDSECSECEKDEADYSENIEGGEKPDARDIDVDSVCAELSAGGPNWVMRKLNYFKTITLSELNRILPFSPPGSTSRERISDCIKKADDAQYKLDDKKRDLEEKLRKLREKSSIHYGSDGALRKLHGQCFKKAVTQYEFEICPFDLVRQYEHGSVIAVLGRFKGWKGDDSNRLMNYAQGDRCWNGPARSIKVELNCGEIEEIVSVEEPNRCAYFMKFKTPAVCEKVAANAIMAEVEEQKEEPKEEL